MAWTPVILDSSVVDELPKTGSGMFSRIVLAVMSRTAGAAPSSERCRLFLRCGLAHTSSTSVSDHAGGYST